VGALRLSFACGRYDRVQPLVDGRVAVEGCDVNVIHLDPEELFWRMLRHEEFDAAEMSLGSFAMLLARGDDRFVGIPVFPSRSFRHSAIWVRDGGGIGVPGDLDGARIGVPEYQMTASVWVRGLLQHELGVDVPSVTWRTGGLDQPGRVERQPLRVPDWVKVEPIPADRTLVEELLDGGIDALTAPRVPAEFRRPGTALRRLLPDWAERERASFTATGIFPIMHLVVLRSEVVERSPWLPASLTKALTEAKDVALAGLADAPALRHTMPFLLAALEEQAEVFGADPWPYGLEPNRRTLEVFLGYLREQGLLESDLAPEALFAPSSLDRSRI
jgi:4,5-dihydroxyphthalate decarboxylase